MIKITDTQSIKEVEKILGYTFKDKDLLIQAFTRSSYRHSHPDEPDNEVLEFRGDSLLRFHVTEYLLANCTKTISKGYVSCLDEGKLSKLRDQYVENDYLAERCKQLKLHTRMRVENHSEKEAKKTPADLLEGLIGAVYTDAVNAKKDTDFLQSMIIRLLDVKLPKSSPAKASPKPSQDLPKVTPQNALLLLNEYCTKNGLPLPAVPRYTDDFDKQHAKHTFTATLQVGKHKATGKGSNQKEALRQAAITLLCDQFQAARR